MKKKMNDAVVAALLSLGVQAQKLVEVTVKNPSGEARQDVPVVMDLKSWGDVRKAVVKVYGKEIPSQLDDLDRDCVNDELCFLVNLGKKEKKTYCVSLYEEGEQAQYTARTFAELCLPSRNKKLAKNQQDIYLKSIAFDKRTKDPYHYVHSHGICFESDLVAMRVYFDHRQTIDLYGKINPGLVIEKTQFYPSEEQIAAGSGDDCLWVGNTYGLGALRGWDGQNQVLLNDLKYQEQRVISEGPLRAIVELDDRGWTPAPGLKPVNATIRYTIYAGHRDFDVDVFFNKNVSNYDFATGLINVKGSSEYADGKGLRGCWGSDWLRARMMANISSKPWAWASMCQPDVSQADACQQGLLHAGSETGRQQAELQASLYQRQRNLWSEGRERVV